MGTYERYRSELKSGDAVFFREHGFFPRLIRRATMSDYCHCGVVWVAGPRIFVIEARQAQGVTMRLLSEALPATWIPTGCNWTKDVETAALMKLQTSYSALAALALGLGLRPPGQILACSLCFVDMVWPGMYPAPEPDRRWLTPGHLGEIFGAAGNPSMELT
jgi:GNAT superfamily N-acetyltransferase